MVLLFKRISGGGEMNNNIHFKIVGIENLGTLVKMRVEFLLDLHPYENQVKIEKLYKENEKYLLKNINKEIFIGILGYVDDIPVCSSGLLLYEMPPVFGENNRQIGHVLNFYTIREYRKNGYGKKMMDFIKETAMEKGITRLFLNATEIGEPLYRKSGFKEPGEKALILDL